MTPPKGSLDRLAVVCAVVLLACIPVRLLSLGYLPLDDALRHAGKAMTSRTWAEILVVRPEITMDSHPGWHAFLRQIQRVTGGDGLDLVFVSVVGLFLLVSLTGLASRQPPYAWFAALLFIMTFDPDVVLRWIMGRPFLLSTAWLLTLIFAWQRRPILARWPEHAAWALVFGLLSFLHPSFYLFALPIMALALAGRWREAGSLGVTAFAGSLLGAILSGAPRDFYTQAILHPLISLGKGATSLVGEFQPADGSPLLVAAAVLLVWHLRGGALTELRLLRSDPTLLLVLMGWVLGFVNRRFWVDWGGPALIALITREMAARGDLVLTTKRSRFAASLAFAGILVLSICSDRGGRWSRADLFFAPLAQPENARLLPDPGGILYSDSMYVFYSVFVRRPEAPFRYVLGFEAGWMKSDDEGVYREALRTGNRALRPWVEKMRPEDRLILISSAAADFPELEWTRATAAVWSARRRPELATPSK